MSEQRRRTAMPTTYGSLAYDLDALVRERQLEEAGAMPVREAAPAPQIQRRARPQAKVRPSPVLALGGIVVCAMVLVLLLGYVRLTEVSDRVGTIKANLSELSDEHIALLTEYEKTYDLATVKSRAEEAGMSKPVSGQVEYIDLAGSDSATVYGGKPSALSRAVTSAEEGLRMVWEYFS